MARCESVMTLGREVSSDASWPLATTQYKGNRNLSRSDENSAGRIVPRAAPWKLGEREGALLPLLVLEGVWDVRLPHGYQRSSPSPAPAESPIPHIQAGDRFRRYLTQRSKGRGFGWKRFPNSKLYAMGLVYIGSGMLEYMAKPAHGVR